MSAGVNHYRKPLFDWANDVLADPEKLWRVPLYASSKSQYGMQVNASWLEDRTGVHRKVAKTDPKIFALLERVVEAMIDAKIVVEGESATANNVRRRILGWYRQLTVEEKLRLPTRSGNIVVERILRHITGISSVVVTTKPVALAIESISEDLRALNPDVQEQYAAARRKKIDRLSQSKNGSRSVILGSDRGPRKPRKTRIRTGLYKAPIEKWLKRAMKRPNLLWGIAIAAERDALTGDVDYRVSAQWAMRAFNLTKGAYLAHRKLLNSVIPVMMDHGVIVPGERALDVNAKRRLRLWFDSLSEEEKRRIPIRNNKISRQYLVEKLGTWSTSRSFKEAMADIHAALVGLGALEPEKSFLSYSAKVQLRDKSRNPQREAKSQAWVRLSEITLDHVDALLEPTVEEPFIQLKQLFARRLIESTAYSSKRNAIDAFARYTDYVAANDGLRPVFLKSHFTNFSLVHYRRHLGRLVSEGIMSPGHANTILSSVRTAFAGAKDIKGLDIPTILHAEGFQLVRTTDTYKPFSDAERQIVDVQIKQDLEQRRRFLAPYKKTGVGRDPFDKNNNSLRGMANEDNARWVFENRLNCKIVQFSKQSDHGSLEAAFVNLLRRLGDHDGYHTVYEKWGIASKIDLEFLFPYFLRMAQLTGLNAESVCNLEIDAYVAKHPATGRACLRYWKERSEGGKEYHCDLFNAELTWLTTKQSREIKALFAEVQHLTERFRVNAPASVRNRLFIYESLGRGVLGFTIKRLNTCVRAYEKKLGIKQFNIARFRPTFVSELIGLGVSLREIQLLLGHSSITTTMSYLDKLDFNKRAREKIKDKLKQIHESTFPKDTSCYSEDGAANPHGECVVFKTPLASCRNIFDPPKFIKDLPSYVAGRPCAAYNKCLACQNVFITSSHLPELFAMQRDYLGLIQRSSIGNTPYGEVIEENLILLNELLNPKYSDFDEEELEAGRRLARYIETSIVVDGVIA